MNYVTGKAISGGTPLDSAEIESLATTHLSALREAMRRPEVEKSGDVLDQRLGEELRLVQRMLEMIEADMRRRGDKIAADAIEQSEEAIEDLADIVEAEDRCDAIATADEDMARRMTRRSLDGGAVPCDNRRPVPAEPDK
ncbi:hypothetical protein [Qipengyuania marisflavi]|uniref:Uncharacterized protein n=1 Tax=Qipengyuania marisflavi TaxID=2486356 RepID=A0A5S3P6J5_9SPHN|nr:hypothetical protein [Qipengyuania marisflavi]TMM48848.1 hypothetical protein FEV51_05515 [Qipengyuania marisflavi]